MRVRTASTTASLVMVALSVAACSGGASGAAAGTKAPAPASPASSGATSSTGTGASNAAAAPTNVDVCADLPVAMASQITGTAFTTTKASSVAGQVFSCEYEGAVGALLQITVTTQAAKNDFDGDISAISTFVKPNKVSGVGDEAFSLPDPNGPGGSAGASSFASYGAVFGTVYIKIGGSYVTPDQGKQIVEALHSKL